MRKQKSIFLFLALILPICIFLFLKFFGKNEFYVAPLYIDKLPPLMVGCQPVTTIPYAVADSIVQQLQFEQDSLVIVYTGETTTESSNQLQRVDQTFGQFPVGVLTLDSSDQHRYWKTCIFFLSDPLDLVLLDRNGIIRGQYTCSDRKEMDRLLTELSIILKQY